MRARANTGIFSNSRAVAMTLALPGTFDGGEMRDRWIVIRDTLIVLGIQIAFRTGMLLRRWNM